jgi:hypothetical protein
MFCTTKAMVLFNKSYGFAKANPLGLFNKSSGFVQQKQWVCSTKVPPS